MNKTSMRSGGSDSSIMEVIFTETKLIAWFSTLWIFHKQTSIFSDMLLKDVKRIPRCQQNVSNSFFHYQMHFGEMTEQFGEMLFPYGL